MSKGRQKYAGTEGPISVLEEVGSQAQYEELKEGAWLELGLVLVNDREVQLSTHSVEASGTEETSE